jgi:hypothetical protein
MEFTHSPRNWEGLVKSILAAAILLAAAGIAQAKEDNNNDDDWKGCSVAAMRDLYIFHPSGFNIVAGVAQPKAVLELIQFNGDGTLTVPAATASINGVVGRSPPNGTGTYTLRPDCTGEVAFFHGPTFDLVVAFKGSELYMIQTGPGSPVMQGMAERLSH